MVATVFIIMLCVWCFHHFVYCDNDTDNHAGGCLEPIIGIVFGLMLVIIITLTLLFIGM